MGCWRQYHGGPATQIFLCEACERQGWGRTRLHDPNSMYDQLLDQVPQREPYCIMRGYLWNYDLLAALDEHAMLLESGHYDMPVCHLILDLLRVNEIRPELVRRIEAELSGFEQSALDRLRSVDPTLDQVVEDFHRAIEQECNRPDSDCPLQ